MDPILADMATAYDDDTFHFDNTTPADYVPLDKPDYTSDDVNYDTPYL